MEVVRSATSRVAVRERLGRVGERVKLTFQPPHWCRGPVLRKHFRWGERGTYTAFRPDLARAHSALLPWPGLSTVWSRGTAEI